MTNEQLALLLELIADQLAGEIDTLEASLPDDLERRSEWWYENRPVSLAPFALRARFPLMSKNERKEQGFKLKPTGTFILLGGLCDVMEELERWSSDLKHSGKGEKWRTKS